MLPLLSPIHSPHQWENYLHNPEMSVLSSDPFPYLPLKSSVHILLFNFYFKYILLIMLLQLSQFFPLALLNPVTPFPTAVLPLSSCPWVVHVNSLASPFLTLFLTSPCLFCTYQLCFLIPALLSPFSPFPFQLITLQMPCFSCFLCLFVFRFNCG